MFVFFGTNFYRRALDTLQSGRAKCGAICFLRPRLNKVWKSLKTIEGLSLVDTSFAPKDSPRPFNIKMAMLPCYPVTLLHFHWSWGSVWFQICSRWRDIAGGIRRGDNLFPAFHLNQPVVRDVNCLFTYSTWTEISFNRDNCPREIDIYTKVSVWSTPSKSYQYLVYERCATWAVHNFEVGMYTTACSETYCLLARAKTLGR